MRITMKKSNAVVGLDIESGSIAATALEVNGATRIGGTYVTSLESGVVDDGEVLDPERLAAGLSAFFSQNKLPKEVRIGVANQRLAMRILRLPLIENREELETAVRFQAQDELPMPIDQAVLDFQVLGRSNEEANRYMDVAVVAARRDMVDGFMEAARRGGLRPVGIDLSAFALIRALGGRSGTQLAPAVEGTGPDGEPVGSVVPTVLYCNLGDLVNLAVARGSICTFARVAPFGLEAIARSLSERQGLTPEHARQWLVHTGLQQPEAELDGDDQFVAASRQALEAGAAKLADELRLSLDFYSNQEGALPVEELVFAGAGAAIDGLADRLGQEIGLPYRIATPQALAHLEATTAARLTVSYGLALEE